MVVSPLYVILVFPPSLQPLPLYRQPRLIPSLPPSLPPFIGRSLHSFTRSPQWPRLRPQRIMLTGSMRTAGAGYVTLLLFLPAFCPLFLSLHPLLTLWGKGRGSLYLPCRVPRRIEVSHRSLSLSLCLCLSLSLCVCLVLSSFLSSSLGAYRSHLILSPRPSLPPSFPPCS